MAKKKPKINLTPTTRPHTGELEQLFTTSDDAEQAAGLQLLALRIDAVKPDPTQPRRSVNQSSLQELADSIRQDGIIQPIEVTQVGDLYIIVHGERRWRASQLAGLETIPAIVRRHEYDDVTRFVRQMVENIQREDLNDVDRAAGLLRLRDLMQEELDNEPVDPMATRQPWEGKITWAKVGKRLGYSRQRIHQLIQLLNLPDEIKDAVRMGAMSERDTRVYQGLKKTHQRDLYQAQIEGHLDNKEVRKVARHLKESPTETLDDAIRVIRTPSPPPPYVDETETTAVVPASSQKPLRHAEGYVEGSSIIPPRTGAPTSIDRLDYVRGHLARIQRQGLTPAERKEVLRLLNLIQRDVTSLIQAIETE